MYYRLNEMIMVGERSFVYIERDPYHIHGPGANYHVLYRSLNTSDEWEEEWTGTRTWAEAIKAAAKYHA